MVRGQKVTETPLRVNQTQSTMGLKADDLAKYAVYFCSAFMFLPAGRDVVAPGASVLPDDDKLLAAMNPGPTALWAFMWNLWGINWCVISVLKILVVSSTASKLKGKLLKLGLAHDVLVTGKLLLDFGKATAVGADMSGFLTLFGLETLALAKLALF